MQGTVPGARRRGRLRTAWMDNIETWTGLPVEESIRLTEDKDKWTKYVHGVANPRIEDGYRTEQNIGQSLRFRSTVSSRTVEPPLMSPPVFLAVPAHAYSDRIRPWGHRVKTPPVPNAPKPKHQSLF